MFREATDLRIVSTSDATRYEVSDHGQIELAQRIGVELHVDDDRECDRARAAEEFRWIKVKFLSAVVSANGEYGRDLHLEE